MLGGVSEAGGAGLVAGEGGHTGLPLGEQGVPHRHVPRVGGVAGGGQQGGGATLEDEVGGVPGVGLDAEEGRGGAGGLPQRRVTVAVTQAELVPLLGEHDPVHLGEHARRPDGGHLGAVAPLPQRHRAVLPPADVEREVRVCGQPAAAVAPVPLHHVGGPGRGAALAQVAPRARGLGARGRGGLGGRIYRIYRYIII